MEKVQCPNCREWSKWKENPYRPFCSEACKSKDLGAWATEHYRIPEEEQNSGMETPPAPKPTGKDEK